MVAMRDNRGVRNKNSEGNRITKSGARPNAERAGSSKTNSPIVGRVKEGASELAQYVRQGVQAVEQTVKEEGEHLYEKQKDKIISRVGGIGKATRQVAHALHAVKADGLAEYVDSAAEGVEDASHYLEESDLRQVLGDAGDLAREHQALAIGGLFVVGFALSRFLRATGSPPEQSDPLQEADSEEQDEES
jgi:hypothetical protein